MFEFFLFLNTIVSILLFANIKIKGNFYLGALILLNVIQGVSALLLSNNYSDKISSVFFLTLAPLSFLIGPSLFFYTRKKLALASTSKVIHLLHLMPCLYFFIICIPYTSSSSLDKIQLISRVQENSHLIFKIKLLIGESSQLYFFRPIHILIYVVISIIYYNKNKTNLTSILTQFQERILNKWLRLLLYSLAVIHICNFLNMLYVYFSNTPAINTRLPLSYVAGLTLTNLTIHIFINPYLLYGFNNVKYYSNDSLIARLHKANAGTKTLFDDKWKSDLMSKIESSESNLQVTEKGYTLAKMSKDTGITLYHLNYYFKEMSEESFTDFKNRKRIEFAIDLINDNYLSTFTVENLSLKCGFASRANFNNAFLKATGKRLKEFKKTVK